jgi:hypothetical protein
MGNILLISNIPPSNAATIADHVNGYVNYSKYSVQSIDAKDILISDAIKKASCIILHYSVVAYPYRQDNFISSKLRLELSLSDKPILHMVQDEQRNILQRFRYFESIGVKHVFSVASEELHNRIYPVEQRNFTVSTLLTGYLPIGFEDWNLKNWNDRRIDVGYRARKLPEWYGKLGEDKFKISDQLNKKKRFSDLVIDASYEENDRKYGVDWIEFLCDSKVAVGTESGCSTLDFDGRFIESWQNSKMVGKFTKNDPVQSNYAAISPRVFEYSAARCLLALTPGEYSGILTKGVHYFELLPDLSNFDDLVSLMNDSVARNRMIDSAYNELILSGKYSYKTMAIKIDEQISRMLQPSELSLKSNQNTGQNLVKVSNNNSKSMLKNFYRLFNQFNLKQRFKTYLFAWALSQRGVFRILLRSIFRFYVRFNESSWIRIFKISLFRDRNNFKVLLFILIFTRSPLVGFKILSELSFLRSESQSLAMFNQRLSMIQTQGALWISWPEKLDRENILKNHPFLDYYKFPESRGVWFTRSDYSVESNPLKLESLSNFYSRSQRKTQKFLEAFCNSLG